MRATNIEIVFDLNVYTRAHFSQRAQITSRITFVSNSMFRVGKIYVKPINKFHISFC